jgi:5-methylthioadenosine/S-adenosylhomocysteine deaminase
MTETNAEHVDLIVVNTGLVITMDRARRVLRGAAIAIANGRITAIGPVDELARMHRKTPTLDADDGWIIPGLIDAHQHLTGDRLARCSIPDDLASGDAIIEWALPLHRAHDGDDDELSATLACVEAVRNGVTTIIEAGTVAHPDRVAAAARRVGVRVGLGRWGWDVGDGPHVAPAIEVVARAAALLDQHPPHGDDLVRGWVALVGHDLMSDELVVAATALARERGARITYHLSPTGADGRAYVARTGRRPLVHLDALGVLGPEVLVAHAVHIDDAELDTLIAHDVAVAACPWAYLRLGQGMAGAARYVELVERGGRLALGCDSENAGDQIDVLRAAALFAGMAKDAAADPRQPGAHLALELATIRGAAAIGRADDLGSIEIGKRADLVIVDTHRPEWQPAGADPALQLVWGTDGRAVRHVVVDGRVVVRDRLCTGVDELALAAAAGPASTSLAHRAGVTRRSRWPISSL